jgi:ceramide synthetase
VALALPLSREVCAWLGATVSRTLLKNAPFNDPLSAPKSMHKFRHQSWQLVVHVICGAYEWYLIRDEPWLDFGETQWQPLPHRQVLPFEMKLFWLIHVALWTYTCFNHVFVFEKQSDYAVMYVHHVATIFLVLMTYRYTYVRNGICVLFCHDVSDVFIDLLKMTNYLKLEGASGRYIVETVFVSNLVSWVYFRLWLFPTKVIWRGCLGAGHDPATGALTFGGRMDDPFDPRAPDHLAAGYAREFGAASSDFWWHRFRVQRAGCALLVLLLVLHVYWFFLFLRIGVRILATGSGHQAGREEYEGDSDDESSTKKE